MGYWMQYTVKRKQHSTLQFGVDAVPRTFIANQGTSSHKAFSLCSPSHPTIKVRRKRLTSKQLWYNTVFILLLFASSLRLKGGSSVARRSQRHGVVGHVRNTHTSVRPPRRQMIRVVVLFITTRTWARRADAHHVEIIDRPVAVAAPLALRFRRCPCDIPRSGNIHRFDQTCCVNEKPRSVKPLPASWVTPDY